MNTSNNFSFRKQSGMTLVELMIVIVVGVSLIAAGYALISLTLSSSKNSKEISNITLVTNGIIAAFENEQDYSGVSDAYVIRSSFFPKTYKLNAAGTQASHSLGDGGRVRFGFTTLVNANDAITITYNGVPQGACQSLVQSLYQFYNRTTVNGVEIANPANIAARCVVTNDLVFTKI